MMEPEDIAEARRVAPRPFRRPRGLPHPDHRGPDPRRPRPGSLPRQPLERADGLRDRVTRPCGAAPRSHSSAVRCTCRPRGRRGRSGSLRAGDARGGHVALRAASTSSSWPRPSPTIARSAGATEDQKGRQPELELVRNPDILADVGAKRAPPLGARRLRARNREPRTVGARQARTQSSRPHRSQRGRSGARRRHQSRHPRRRARPRPAPGDDQARPRRPDSRSRASTVAHSTRRARSETEQEAPN